MPERGSSFASSYCASGKNATRLIIVTGTPLGIFDLRVKVTFGFRNHGDSRWS